MALNIRDHSWQGLGDHIGCWEFNLVGRFGIHCKVSILLTAVLCPARIFSPKIIMFPVPSECLLGWIVQLGDSRGGELHPQLVSVYLPCPKKGS